MDDYWDLMPKYQGVNMDDLTFKRALFGVFPTFRESPLQPGFDRVLQHAVTTSDVISVWCPLSSQIGDASGIQSPLSFGGFGALMRHLRRLTNAVSEALDAEALDKESLGAIHAYNPGLSAAWMLQRAMSARPGQLPDKQLINRMLSGGPCSQTACHQLQGRRHACCLIKRKQMSVR
eukprot:355955-Chlamydomonas_euryale.AAC.4